MALRGAPHHLSKVRCPFLIPTLTNSTEDQKRGLTCGYAEIPTAVGGLCHRGGSQKSRHKTGPNVPARAVPHSRADVATKGDQGSPGLTREWIGRTTFTPKVVNGVQHHIEPPMIRGLVLLRHRLAAARIEQNRLRLAEIHGASASLPQVPPEGVQSGSGQAETPRSINREASSTTSLLRRPSWLETA